MLTQAIAQAMDVPPAYPNVNMDRYKERSPAWTEKSKIVRIKPIVKNDLPSPCSYNPQDLRQSYRERTVVLPFNKEKKCSFAETYSKKKSFVPSPSVYNTEKCFDKITIGARRSYK